MQGYGNRTVLITLLAVELHQEVYLSGSLDKLEPAEDLPRGGQ